MKDSTPQGHLHPITLAIAEINRIFSEMGFVVAQGPEIETEFYNFDALNIPADHPARDMQDTFWLKPPKPPKSSGAEQMGQHPSILNQKVNYQRVEQRAAGSLEQAGGERGEHGEPAQHRERGNLLLRTHTSPVQIRYMQSHKPPFRIIVPGKVFRNEATDATHEAEFYQLEGLLIDRAGEISLAHLKGTLTQFFQRFFGKDENGNDVAIRFRPSYFPFVEPAVEVDMLFKGKWLEMMGAGMVHPNVLRAGGIEPANGKGVAAGGSAGGDSGWSGFAFGGGIDRLVMVKYGIDDIRLLYAGDLRLVNQF